jgi:hypothetical protein
MNDTGPGDLSESLDILMDVLLDAAEEDEEVRDSLHLFREWLDERLDELEESGEGRRPRQLRPRARREPQPRGRRDGPQRRRGGEEIDLELVRQRAQIKSEACRFAAWRRRLLARGADQETEIDPKYKELVGRAKALHGCYAWPLDSNRQLPGDNELELLARCYENVSMGVHIAQRAVSNPGSDGVPSEEMLYLLAEAQSALRAALQATDLRNDEDQIQTYIWVKEQAYDQDKYVSRFMRVEDPADPLQWGDLRTRMEAFAQKIEGDESQDAERRELLSRLRHELERLESDHAGSSGEHWQKILGTLDKWVEEGRPAASRELCQLLLPWTDRVPAELEPSERAQRVLSAAERMRAAREARAAARAGSA